MHKLRPAALSVAILALALVVGVSLVAALTGKIPGIFPDEGLTDAERQARVDQAHAREVQFLVDFVAKGSDPRALPRLYLADFAGAPTSLNEAIRQADLVVRGRVVATSFAPSDEGLAVATASVEVSSVIKGPGSSEITVVQRGGPVPQDTGGALAQFESDPLVLPGDEVFLLLVKGSDAYQTVPGAGVYLVVDGKVDTIKTPQESPLNATLDGLPESEFAESLMAAQSNG